MNQPRLRAINVNERGVDARAQPRFYDMGRVTGVDFRVQGNILMQQIFVDVLREAVLAIVCDDLHEFAFVCSFGRHRSVGSAVLSNVIAFPRARLALPSNVPAQIAAIEAGLQLVGQDEPAAPRS